MKSNLYIPSYSHASSNEKLELATLWDEIIKK